MKNAMEGVFSSNETSHIFGNMEVVWVSFCQTGGLGVGDLVLDHHVLQT